MNWKNVYYLMQINRKSGRLMRGTNTIKFKDNRVFDFLSYGLPIGLGLVGGIFAWFIANLLFNTVGEIQSVAAGIFVSLPTFVLIASAVLTLLFQLQRSGVKLQAETPYWLPITWQEHTLASILASLLGLPLAVVLILTSAILTFSIFSGLILLAIVTSIAMFAAAFLSSTLMEILRVLQVRFTGAIYKSSGRGAIWIRFIGSLAFLLIFFTIYMTFIYGSINFISTVYTIQNSIFYIPFVWLGLMLSNFFLTGGSTILGIVYLILSLAFIGSMYTLAFLLNKRFGLYEPPAIKIQKTGNYTPKTGLLGKLGFTTTEAAIINKDFKAFTRRKELISVFITPILFMIIPLLQSFGATSTEDALFATSLINAGMAFLFPASFMVILIGVMIIGQEGPAIWHIYASPINAKGLIKSKYVFTVFFGLIMLIITGIIGTILYNVSTTIIIICLLEASFLTFTLGAISLYFGFIGADFTEVPRPRMIRQSWMLICMAICAIIGLIILTPLIPTALSTIDMFTFNIPSLNPFIATAISGIIATIITIIFHKLTLNYTKDFLQKAEI
ncbi:MAG: hypothetical protein FWE56_03880 [Candidatus Bathyarchaeota archaeon]|nr:hypothetical protein [Candidatus Termiticorpusculum sp.]MCL2868565.1 hypothetical protein [Candidatus Termiticorpusculum sp.]